MILFKCSQCGGALKTSNPNLVGKKIKCPKCGAAVPVPAESDGPAAKPKPLAPAPMAGKPKAGAPAKAAPTKPPPPSVSDWDEEEAPAPPKAKAKKPVAQDDWGGEDEAPPSKPAAKPKKKGGIDAVAILVLLLLVGYIAAVVLFMLDIVQI